MSAVSDYEAARLANIQKNNELLLSLGLTGASAIFDSVKDKPPPKLPKPSKAVKRQASVALDKAEDDKEYKDERSPGPSSGSSSRRASARRSAGSTPNYNLKDLSRASRRTSAGGLGASASAAASPSSQDPNAASSSSSSRRRKSGNATPSRFSLPRPAGARSSARISAQSPSKVNRSYTELSDSEDSSKDDDDAAAARKRGPGAFLFSSKGAGPKLDASENIEGTGPYEEYERQPLPRLTAANAKGKGKIIFEDRWKIFTPNLTPAEMMRGGMFGGTAFRRHFSTVTRSWLEPDVELAALPQDWLQGIDIPTQLTREEYEPSINRWGVKASQSLADWEKQGWVREWDPRAWWGWYIQFYQGRRCSDDARQISRWLKAAGPAGRFKRSLIKAVAAAGGKDAISDGSVAPILRQTCWHWAVELTQEDYEEAVGGGRSGGS